MKELGFAVDSPEDILRGIREYPDLTVWEWCSDCQREVEIPAYGRSFCPACGAPILPCSMCSTCREPCVYEALSLNVMIHPELQEICYRGKCQKATEWAEETGIPLGTLRYRVLHGWPMEKVFDRAKFSHGKRYAGMKMNKRHTAHGPKDWIDERTSRTVSEWSRVTGIPTYVLYQRLKDGLTLAEAIEKPYSPKAPLTFTLDGVTLSLYEWSKEVGIPYYVLRYRIDKGSTFEEAVSTPYIPRSSAVGSVASKNKKHRLRGWFGRFRR